MVRGKTSGKYGTGSRAPRAHWCAWRVKAGLFEPISRESYVDRSSQCMVLRCPCWSLSTPKIADNGYVSVRIGQWSNGRRWPALMNHGFFYIMCMAMCLCIVSLGKNWHQDILWTEGKLAKAVWCLGPAIHMDVTLTHTTNLKIIAGQVLLSMAVVFTVGSGLVQQDNAPFRTAKLVQEWFGKHDMASKFSSSQSYRVSVEFPWKTSLIHGAPPCTLQDVRDLLLTSWWQIPQDTFKDLTDSMPLQVKAVFVARVDPHNNWQVVFMLCLVSVALVCCLISIFLKDFLFYV